MTRQRELYQPPHEDCKYCRDTLEETESGLRTGLAFALLLTILVGPIIAVTVWVTVTVMGR